MYILHISCFKVYPRVCGGILFHSMSMVIGSGLSPRVRGNQLTNDIRLTPVGSIPACAGESTGISFFRVNITVYPRVCGGILGVELIPQTPIGLSPRVRGNLHWYCLGFVHLGSIPACAGESLWLSLSTNSLWVYPRVCGGIHQNSPQSPSA